MRAINLTDPNELKVVSGWLQESRIRMARNVLFGSAAIVGAAGLGLTGAIWAAGQSGPTVAERAAELKAALAELPPLKLDPVAIAPGSKVALEKGGTVALEDGGEVSLKEGGFVTLKDGSIVRLEPGSSVKVVGELKAPPMPPLPSGKTPAKTADGDVIKRTVTVFQNVDFSDGQVATGWEYPNGAGKSPQRTYCYFIHALADGSEQRISLGADGQAYPGANRLMADFNSAFSKCVWWKGTPA